VARQFGFFHDESEFFDSILYQNQTKFFIYRALNNNISFLNSLVKPNSSVKFVGPDNRWFDVICIMQIHEVKAFSLKDSGMPTCGTKVFKGFFNFFKEFFSLGAVITGAVFINHRGWYQLYNSGAAFHLVKNSGFGATINFLPVILNFVQLVLRSNRSRCYLTRQSWHSGCASHTTALRCCL